MLKSVRNENHPCKELSGSIHPNSPFRLPCQAIFRPAIGTWTRVVVREIFPRVVSTVVLADGTPGTFGKIRFPALPVLLSVRDSAIRTSSLVMEIAWSLRVTIRQG